MEHHLAKVGAAGSNPVSRSFLFQRKPLFMGASAVFVFSIVSGGKNNTRQKLGDLYEEKRMEFLWEPCKIGKIEGARILRVLGEDSQAEIPEEIWENRECTKKLPVIELGDYVFSSMMRKEPERNPDLADIPPVCGDKLESVTLPRKSDSDWQIWVLQL